MSNGHPWTPDDIARLKRLVASGMTDSQIGEVMGRHRGSIGLKRRELDVRPGRSAVFDAMMARINKRRKMARA